MNAPVETGNSDLNSEIPPYQFQLYVTGASVHSIRAIANIKHICETYLAGLYSLEIIDVYQQMQLAESIQLVALPLLIKQTPWPQRRLIGDLSDTVKVLNTLGIPG